VNSFWDFLISRRPFAAFWQAPSFAIQRWEIEPKTELGLNPKPGSPEIPLLDFWGRKLPKEILGIDSVSVP
jgi:hypothetical protein